MLKKIREAIRQWRLKRALARAGDSPLQRYLVYMTHEPPADGTDAALQRAEFMRFIAWSKRQAAHMLEELQTDEVAPQ